MAKIEIVPLTEERKKEMALIILKHEFINESRNLNKADFYRRLGTTTEKLKELKITKEELVSLYHDFITEGVENLFK